jgi:hypothetical protein
MKKLFLFCVGPFRMALFPNFRMRGIIDAQPFVTAGT